LYSKIKEIHGCFLKLAVPVLLLSVACQHYKEHPYPAPDLNARNERLKEVKLRLKTLESAGEATTLEMLGHPDHRVRRRAAGRLGELGVSDTRAIEKLAAAVEDPRREVRIEAISALSKIGTTEALEPLVRALADDDYKVRLWAFKGLVRSSDRSVPLLIRHLAADSPIRSLSYFDEMDQRHDIKDLLIECLSSIGKPAVAPLKNVLSNDDLETRKNAAIILGNIGRDAAEAVRDLLEIANSEEDIELRKNALAAIGQIGDMDPEVTPTLLGLTQGDNPIIAGSARQVLKEFEKNENKRKR
jgi:HEAT repeat protein